MTDLKNSRLPSWTRPPRPDWVEQVNREGSIHDLSAVVPLDEESLIGWAVRNTGLSDFGDDDWREPFGALVRGIDAEGQLNLMGRILTRSEILMFLEARLRVEDMYKKHPEIDHEVIEKPIWVVGQGRSGTTLLHTLLQQPPENRTTTDLDALFPVPIPGWSEEKRRETAHARVTQWSRVSPHINSIHEFGAHKTCETFRIEALGFRAVAWLGLLGLSPSYGATVASEESFVKTMEYGKRVYKLLQWQKPGGQWVLRNNHSVLYLPLVLKVFPDARIVWSHRDPIKAMSSMVDMIGTMMSVRTDQQVTQAFDFVTDPSVTAQMLSTPVDWVEAGAVPRAQLCNVQYVDLVRDPLGTVESIYDYFGLEFSDAARKAVAAQMEEHPRDNRPAHTYSHGEQEQIRAERVAFQRYQEFFNVKNEF